MDERTNRKLTSSVQTLDFVDSVSDVLEDVVESFFPGNFLSSVQDEVRVWSHVVLNLQETIRGIRRKIAETNVDGDDV